jgi:hypothetical protein
MGMRIRGSGARARAAIAVLTLVTTGTVVPTAVAGRVAEAAPALPPFPGFTLSADGCTGVSANFVLPTSRAQAAVPAPFHVYDYAGVGQARGTIRVTRCDRMRVDGGPPAPATFSSVLIDIDPPKAPGASSHYYELWRLDGRTDLHQRFATAGMVGEQVSDLALDQLAPSPLSVVEATAPWSQASYTVVLATPDPTGGLPLLDTESTWHKGPRGTFRTFASNVEAQHVGPAVVSSSDDLAGLMGLSAAVLPGFLRVFSFTAKVEAVPVT